MPQVTMSAEMHERLQEFKQVVETVIQEQIEFDHHVELVLDMGINHMLALLIGASDQETLVRSIQQLGTRSPAVVYGYVAEMLKAGPQHGNRKGYVGRLASTRDIPGKFFTWGCLRCPPHSCLIGLCACCPL